MSTLKQPIGPAIYTRDGWKDPVQPVKQYDGDAIHAGYAFIGVVLLLGVITIVVLAIVFA